MRTLFCHPHFCNHHRDIFCYHNKDNFCHHQKDFFVYIVTFVSLVIVFVRIFHYRHQGTFLHAIILDIFAVVISCLFVLVIKMTVDITIILNMNSFRNRDLINWLILILNVIPQIFL